MAREAWNALRRRPLLFAAFAAAIAALSAPLFAARYLPFQDLPQHLALASVIRHGSDPAWGFDRFFVVQWLELSTYWTQYASLALLALVMPLELAAKVQLALVLGATLLAAASACRAFGRSPWGALLVAPTLYNTNLHYGFISFCMAVPLWLWSLAATERLLAAPTRRRAVIAGALYAATFFTHQQMFVLLGATVGVLVLCHRAPQTWRARAWRLAPLAAVCLLLFLPWILGTLVFTPLDARGGGLKLDFRTADELVGHFFAAIMATLQDKADRGVWIGWALLSSAAILLRDVDRDASGGWRAALHTFRLEALLAVTTAGFLFMPSSMKGAFYISPRFLALALLLWALLPRFRNERVAAGLGLVAVALTVWLGAIFQREYRRFDVEVGALDAALATLPIGSATLWLSYDPESKVVMLEPFRHIGAYAMVRRGGIISNTFAKVPGVPIRYRSGATPFSSKNSDPLSPANVAFFDHVLVYVGPSARKGGGTDPAAVVAARTAGFPTLYEDDRWIVLAYPPRPAAP